MLDGHSVDHKLPDGDGTEYALLEGDVVPDGTLMCILGKLEAGVDHLRDRVDEIADVSRSRHDKTEELLADMNERMRTVENAILTAHVSWKVILTLFSIATGFAGVLAILGKIFYKPLEDFVAYLLK